MLVVRLRPNMLPILLAVLMFLGTMVPLAPIGSADHPDEPVYHYQAEEIPPLLFSNQTGWDTLPPGERVSTTVTVPAYPFYGHEGLTEVTITSTGALLPAGQTWSSECYGHPLPLDDCQNGLFAGLWTDLDTTHCGEIRYAVDDTHLKVFFDEVAYDNERRCEEPLQPYEHLVPLVFPTRTVTFGMSLSFADGTFEVHLLDVPAKYLATTGVEAPNGTAGTTARFSSGGEPSTGFRFTRAEGAPPGDGGSDPDPDPDENETSGSHYRVREIPARAVNTTAWSTLSLSDDQSVRRTIPTTPFWNRNVTDMYVSSNGFVSLDGTQDSGCCSPGPIPSDDHVNGIIAGLWTDLNPSTCGRIAVTTSDEFVGITYEDVPYFGENCVEGPLSPEGAKVSFWIGITPEDGTIEVHLLRVDGGRTAATGVESHDGLEGNETRRTANALTEPLAWEFTRHGGAPDGDPVDPDPGDEPAKRDPPQQGADSDEHAVVAFMDTGINPYHVTYRDTSAQALEHPSTYIPGYPEDALPLNITLDALDWDEVVAYDCERVWSEIVPNQLYYFPGTKIVGAIYFGDGAGANCDTSFPRVAGILDYNGHGTMVSSRGASFEYGACRECKIVAVQSPLVVDFDGDHHEDAFENLWIAEHAGWIDAQSNSWGPFLPVPLTDDVPQQYVGATPQLARNVENVSQAHLAFWASGNGILFRFGVLGHPTAAAFHMTPSAIIVGGYDSGYINVWPGFSPHLASDSCASWAAHSRDTAYSDGSIGGGTSAATPYAAGHAAKILLEARRILGDGETGVDDGIVARGTPPAGLTMGPLADGTFTLAEWKDLVFKSADPRPSREHEDGNTCLAPYGHTSIQWDQVPPGYPEFVHIGYGGTTHEAFDTARDVLYGAAPMPDRTVTDVYFTLDRAARQAVFDAYTALP